MAIFTKKKKFLVIFGKFKKRNPRAIGFFRRILDRNVVVHRCIHVDVYHNNVNNDASTNVKNMVL